MTTLFADTTRMHALNAPFAPSPAPRIVPSDWREVINVFVPGDPKAQPRPRAFARKFGDKFSARVYDAGTAENWKSEIALAVRPYVSNRLNGPVRVDADFLFKRPEKLNRKCDPDGEFEHTQKPDRDNLEKALLDCLNVLGLFAKDDSQVCAGEPRKFWTAKRAPAGMRLRVSVKSQLLVGGRGEARHG
jgi:Holliday junction resolvase RusA-like endonuclease